MRREWPSGTSRRQCRERSSPSRCRRPPSAYRRIRRALLQDERERLRRQPWHQRPMRPSSRNAPIRAGKDRFCQRIDAGLSRGPLCIGSRRRSVTILQRSSRITAVSNSTLHWLSRSAVVVALPNALSPTAPSFKPTCGIDRTAFAGARRASNPSAAWCSAKVPRTEKVCPRMVAPWPGRHQSNRQRLQQRSRRPLPRTVRPAHLSVEFFVASTPRPPVNQATYGAHSP